MGKEFDIDEISQQPEHYIRAHDFMLGLDNLQPKGSSVSLFSLNYTQQILKDPNKTIARIAEIESATKTEVLVRADSDSKKDLEEFASRLDIFAAFCQAQKLDNSRELILQNPNSTTPHYRLFNFFVFSEPNLVLPQKPPLN